MCVGPAESSPAVAQAEARSEAEQLGESLGDDPMGRLLYGLPPPPPPAVEASEHEPGEPFLRV